MRRIALLFLLISVALTAAAQASPTVSGLTDTGSTPQYGKFEATFNVSTAATNVYWPYDAAPNTGVPAQVGVSVDGLFSNDNWQTTIIQPGFYFQDFSTGLDSSGATRLLSNGRTWVLPNGNPCWKVRFAPTSAGQWNYKIRVTDAGGSYTSSQQTFTCTPSQSHGFVRVSPKDSRYFELSDGTFVPMIGLSYDSGSIADLDAKYEQMNDMGINLVRSWWQSSDPPLALFGAGGQGGDGVWTLPAYSTDYLVPGHIVVVKITQNGGAGNLSTTIGVNPNTSYLFTARVKLVGLTGTGTYGLHLGAWPAAVGTDVNATSDWQTVSLPFTTPGNCYEMTWLSVSLENVTGGAAYVSDVSLKQDLGGGQVRPGDADPPGPPGAYELF